MRRPLDYYDDRPESMKRYLKYYGQHFNKKLCDFAVSKMKHGKAPVSKELVEENLNKYNVTLEHNELYDHVYVYNMGNNDFYGSSIKDEKHLALYVKGLQSPKKKEEFAHFVSIYEKGTYTQAIVFILTEAPELYTQMTSFIKNL